MISVEVTQKTKPSKDWDVVAIAELVFSGITNSDTGSQHFAIVGDDELLFAVSETLEGIASFSEDESIVLTYTPRGARYDDIERMVHRHIGSQTYRNVGFVNCDIDIKVTF
jgi:hypothetical protein